VTIHLSLRTVALALAAFLALTALATTSLVLTLVGRAEANDRFSDIAADTFFHEPTKWLKDNGIADGFGDGTFQPHANITRGQAAYWFANYNDSIEIVSNPFPASAATTLTGKGAACPSGKRAIGGGGDLNSPSGHYLASSYPFLRQQLDGRVGAGHRGRPASRHRLRHLRSADPALTLTAQPCSVVHRGPSPGSGGRELTAAQDGL
jgi:hypothetical protein